MIVIGYKSKGITIELGRVKGRKNVKAKGLNILQRNRGEPKLFELAYYTCFTNLYKKILF